MSMLLVGELRDVAERVAGREPNTWVETVLYVLDGRNVTSVTVAQGQNFTFRGEVPTVENIGEAIALEVGVRTYCNKAGEPRYSVTAFGRSSRVESFLADRASVSA